MNLRRKLFLAAAAAGVDRAGSAWAQTLARVVRIGWITNIPFGCGADPRTSAAGDQPV